MDASPNPQPNPAPDCLHFTGIGRKVCDAGIVYDTVKTSHSPNVGFSIPCKPSMSQVECKPCPKYQPKPEDKTNE